MTWSQRMQTTLAGFKQDAERIAATAEQAADLADAQTNQAGRRGFFGGTAALDDYYFPNELTGGVCPRVAGQEREIAWHAAAEACDSERIHLVWSVTEDKVWYLAARAAEFASRPHTWCPFAPLLPGQVNALPAPICYTYYSDEAAVMMTVTDDALQVHRGTSAVVRAKADRLSRDLGGAKLLTVDAEMIVKLAPVAWHSVALFDDRLRRLLTLLVVATGLTFATIAFFSWLLASVVIVQQQRRLDDVHERTQQKTAALMEIVERMRASTLREQAARLAELNDGLVQVGGWMKFYQIRGGKVRWRALVPPSVTGDKIKELGGQLLSATEKGVLIGTDDEPVGKR